MIFCGYKKSPLWAFKSGQMATFSEKLQKIKRLFGQFLPIFWPNGHFLPTFGKWIWPFLWAQKFKNLPKNGIFGLKKPYFRQKTQIFMVLEGFVAKWPLFFLIRYKNKKNKNIYN